MIISETYLNTVVAICSGFIENERKNRGLASQLFDCVKSAVTEMGMADPADLFGKEGVATKEVTMLLLKAESQITAQLVELDGADAKIEKSIPSYAATKSHLIQGMIQEIDPREYDTFNQYRAAKIEASKAAKAKPKKEKKEEPEVVPTNVTPISSTVSSVTAPEDGEAVKELLSLIDRVRELERVNQGSARRLVTNFHDILDKQLAGLNKGGRYQASMGGSR